MKIHHHLYKYIHVLLLPPPPPILPIRLPGGRGGLKRRDNNHVTLSGTVALYSLYIMSMMALTVNPFSLRGSPLTSKIIWC